MKLISRNVKRLFAFGCSFTKYHWATWPEIVGLDLNVPTYNYGRSGGGNQFIANTLCQADSIHHFDENDLIIISWTNVSREDRWVNGNWITPGNIYTQNIYDNNFVTKWADPVGYLNRDLATIKLTKKFLEHKHCQFHFLSMCDLTEQFDQNSNHKEITELVQSKYEKLLTFYSEEIKFIQPSFFKVLWNNNIWKNKFQKGTSSHFQDGHPYPEEHFKYLRTIFDEHLFKGLTIEKITESQENFLNFINQRNEHYKKTWAVYELDFEKNKEFYDTTKIFDLEPIEII